MANPTFSNVVNVGDLTDLASRATGSRTFSANRLYLLSVCTGFVGGSGPVEPTCSGWTSVASRLDSSVNRTTVFRRMVGSDTTENPTLDWGADTQLFIAYSIDIASSDTDTSGTNGSGAIVQSKVDGNTGVQQNVVVTLDSAFSSTDNSVIGIFGQTSGSAAIVGGTFTVIASPGVHAFSDRSLVVQYKAANDTTVDLSWDASYDTWSAIALEIKAATGAGSTVTASYLRV